VDLIQNTAGQPAPAAITAPSGRSALLIAKPSALSVEIRDFLESLGCQVVEASSSRDVLSLTWSTQPYLAVLDADLLEAETETGSHRLIESFRSNPYTGSTPIVVVSAGAMTEDAQIKLFRQGAEDCLIRPVSTELFRARLRAVCRRHCHPAELQDELRANNLVLDTRARKVLVKNRQVALTRKEFDLLNTLLRKRGMVVYTAHLYHTVWGYGESAPVDSHTVKVHISSLRGKLGPELGAKIVNLPSLGYRFDD
jgi:two-component system, OmpR family, alkaline phosphatase synthesis response regulator PhoP